MRQALRDASATAERYYTEEGTGAADILNAVAFVNEQKRKGIDT